MTRKLCGGLSALELFSPHNLGLLLNLLGLDVPCGAEQFSELLWAWV